MVAVHRPMRDTRSPSSSQTDRHAESYYTATVREPLAGTALDGSAACDACIVGGGYTGLSAALHLARRGAKVVLLEQALIGWGASGRNGGQVHCGMRRDPRWMARRLGSRTALGLWQLAMRAREHLDWLIQAYSIDCDFRTGLLHADHRTRYTSDSRSKVDYLRRELGCESVRFVGFEEIRDLVATDQYVSGTLDERGGHLHPLNFALGIARAARSHGAQLYERTAAQSLRKQGSSWQIVTPQGTVTADRVLLAANGYLHGLAPAVESRVMPINNFIATTEPLGAARAAALIRNGYAVSDSRFVVYYFRITPDHRLLFGGGETYSYRFPDDIATFVRRHIRRVFPQLASVTLDYAWGGTLAITPNRMPYVREIEPGVYNASGYSGMGVVLAPYFGRVMAEAMAGERAEFDLLRSIAVPRFPGGPRLRFPTLVAAMSLAAALDHF